MPLDGSYTEEILFWQGDVFSIKIYLVVLHVFHFGMLGFIKIEICHVEC